MLSKVGGTDITNLFTRTASNYNKCNCLKFRVTQADGRKRLATGKFMRSVVSLSAPLVNSDVSVAPVLTLGRIGRDLFVVCLVTCYTESEDNRKLLFVIADGMTTGAGEKKNTPSLEADPRLAILYL
jgi:hypothetical protein